MALFDADVSSQRNNNLRFDSDESPVALAALKELRAVLSHRAHIILPSSPLYPSECLSWNGSVVSRPALIVKCVGTADICATIRFATKYGIPTAVRNARHSIAGVSTINGGLVLDVSLMKAVLVNAEDRTVTVECGCQIYDVDRETGFFGLAAVLGNVSHTGVVGLTLGGGIGTLSRAFGLAIDNVLWARVVLASGKVVRASPTENKDLFWALRGAGANFGVVTAVQYRVHPVRHVYTGVLEFRYADAQRVLDFVRAECRRAPDRLAVSFYVSVKRNVPPPPPGFSTSAATAAASASGAGTGTATASAGVSDSGAGDSKSSHSAAGALGVTSSQSMSSAIDSLPVDAHPGSEPVTAYSAAAGLDSHRSEFDLAASSTSSGSSDRFGSSRSMPQTDRYQSAEDLRPGSLVWLADGSSAGSEGGQQRGYGEGSGDAWFYQDDDVGTAGAVGRAAASAVGAASAASAATPMHEVKTMTVEEMAAIRGAKQQQQAGAGAGDTSAYAALAASTAGTSFSAAGSVSGGDKQGSAASAPPPFSKVVTVSLTYIGDRGDGERACERLRAFAEGLVAPADEPPSVLDGFAEDDEVLLDAAEPVPAESAAGAGAGAGDSKQSRAASSSDSSSAPGGGKLSEEQLAMKMRRAQRRQQWRPIKATAAEWRMVAYADTQRMLDDVFPHGRKYYMKSGVVSPRSRTFQIVLQQFDKVTSPYALIGFQMLGGQVSAVSPDATAFAPRSAPFTMEIMTAWDTDDEVSYSAKQGQQTARATVLSIFGKPEGASPEGVSPVATVADVTAAVTRTKAAVDMSTVSLRSTGSAGSTGSADAGAGAGAAGSGGELSDSLAGAFTASQLQRAYDQAVAAGVDSSALNSLAAADSRAEAEVSRRPLHIAPLEVFPTAPRAELRVSRTAPSLPLAKAAAAEHKKLDAAAQVRAVSEAAAASVSRQGSGQEQQLQEQRQQGVVDDFGGGNAPEEDDKVDAADTVSERGSDYGSVDSSSGGSGSAGVNVHKRWVRRVFAALTPHFVGVYTNFIADPPGDAESAAADGDATEKEAAASKPSARIRMAYGMNYPRLRQLKLKYDKDNFFHACANILPARKKDERLLEDPLERQPATPQWQRQLRSLTQPFSPAELATLVGGARPQAAYAGASSAGLAAAAAGGVAAGTGTAFPAGAGAGSSAATAVTGSKAFF